MDNGPNPRIKYSKVAERLWFYQSREEQMVGGEWSWGRKCGVGLVSLGSVVAEKSVAYSYGPVITKYAPSLWESIQKI